MYVWCEYIGVEPLLRHSARDGAQLQDQVRLPQRR